ncbi:MULTISPECIES: hypothetical protein [Methanococcoides]|nr:MULTISPECIES: hypothetical protein [Methanococcoides]
MKKEENIFLNITGEGSERFKKDNVRYKEDHPPLLQPQMFRSRKY